MEKEFEKFRNHNPYKVPDEFFREHNQADIG
jgi:hypothetical protein